MSKAAIEGLTTIWKDRAGDQTCDKSETGEALVLRSRIALLNKVA